MAFDAQYRGWGNPDNPNFRKNNIVKLEVAGITVYVHKGVKYLFQEFVKELVATGYSVDKVKDDGAYANRNIFIHGRDTGKKSNHAWGLALDINSTANVVSYDGRVHGNLPANVSKIAAKYGLFWGGNYHASDYRDPMHFEFLGTPGEAVALIAKLSRAKKKATPSRTVKSIPKTKKGKPQQYRVVRVHKGDSYWRLAQRYYHRPLLYKRIQRANKGKALIPGALVRIPW